MYAILLIKKKFQWGTVLCFLCCVVFSSDIETLQLFWHTFLYFHVDLAVQQKSGKQSKTKSSSVFLVKNYQNQRNKKKDTENEELGGTLISLKQEKTNFHIIQSVRINQDAFIRLVWTWLCCDSHSVHEPPSCVALKQNPVFATLRCPIPKHQVLDVPSAAA